MAARFASAAPPPPPVTSAREQEHVVKEGGPSLLLPISLLGGGAAAIGVASYFWLSGLSDHSSMGSGCAVTHSCSQSAVNAGQTKLVVGDVLGGVGVLAAAAGVGVLIFGHASAQAPAAAVVVQPAAGGAAASVVGRF